MCDMKIKIKITREVLNQTENCVASESTINCAIAYAIREIFPHASTCSDFIIPFYYLSEFSGDTSCLIELPNIARRFIVIFDSFRDNPRGRRIIAPIDFEIEIPDEVIERIDISSIHKSQTLELVS